MVGDRPHPQACDPWMSPAFGCFVGPPGPRLQQATWGSAENSRLGFLVAVMKWCHACSSLGRGFPSSLRETRACFSPGERSGERTPSSGVHPGQPESPPASARAAALLSCCRCAVTSGVSSLKAQVWWASRAAAAALKAGPPPATVAWPCARPARVEWGPGATRPLPGAASGSGRHSLGTPRGSGAGPEVNGEEGGRAHSPDSKLGPGAAL